VLTGVWLRAEKTSDQRRPMGFMAWEGLADFRLFSTWMGDC